MELLPTPNADARVDVLLVVDDPKTLLALEGVLADLEPHLVRATAGIEALDRLTRTEFAVAILDLQGPGLDGLTTAALIRAREGARRMPIVVLTTLDASDARIGEGYELGAVDFLFKPVVSGVGTCQRS